MIKNNDYLILINKVHELAYNYVPHDLKRVSSKYAAENKYLRKKAKKKFEKLCSKAYKKGYRIKAISAYRDYDYQKELFQQYVKEKGSAYALTCSAKPGHSEHQTGLAVDVEGSNNDYNNFIDTKEYIWLKDNAHKYGFILRYPLNKEHITGYKFEPWHYRFVGKAAKKIYKNKLTLEEYLK